MKLYQKRINIQWNLYKPEFSWLVVPFEISCHQHSVTIKNGVKAKSFAAITIKKQNFEKVYLSGLGIKNTQKQKNNNHNYLRMDNGKCNIAKKNIYIKRIMML